MQQSLRAGFANSEIPQIHGTRMIRRAYVPGGRAATQLEDLRMAQALSTLAGVGLPHLESAVALYQALVARGRGDLDHSALHPLLWENSGEAPG